MKQTLYAVLLQLVKSLKTNSTSMNLFEMVLHLIKSDYTDITLHDVH